MIRFSVSGQVGSVTAAMERRLPAATRALETAVLRSCEPFVPYRTGELCRSGTVSGTGLRGEIRYTAPHAATCYYATRRFNKKHHPHATARWLEAARAVDGAKWAAAVSAALSR